MKYFCKVCGDIIIPGERTKYAILCNGNPICACGSTMELIPYHETPEHFEERTGSKLPINAAVFIKCDDKYGCDCKNICDISNVWTVASWAYACAECQVNGGVTVVIADPPVPSSHEWRPEEVVK
jgi:hypothetical protein